MRRVAGPLLLLVALAALPRGAYAQRDGSAIPVRAGTTIEPDTVRVGDPFVVRVRVQAPNGSEVLFPDPPDSTGTVQALDPVRIDTSDATAALDLTAVYRVAAWDIASQRIRLGDIVVRTGGAERRVPLRNLTVFVQTVLPADSTQHVPKPARPIFEWAPSLWWVYALIAAALALLALAYWLWRRRRRRPRLLKRVDPYEHAEKEFARIEALGLLEAGERGRYVALMVEVLRDYLAARFDAAALSLTSSELIAALRGQRGVAHERLRRVLEEADLVKFARRPVSSERARELGREARSIVAHEHAASRPAAEAAA